MMLLYWILTAIILSGELSRAKAFQGLGIALHDCKLIVSTGCADSGLLVGHPFLLNLSDQRLIWTEIPAVWTPPPRPDHVGISLPGGRILVLAGCDRVSLCGEHQMFPGTLQYMLGK